VYQELKSANCGITYPFRLPAAGDPLPPLTYHCSPFRGYSVPLPPATMSPMGTSPTRSPSLSRQMKGSTVQSSTPGYRGSRRPRQTEESSRSTSLPLDASLEVGRNRATGRQIYRRKSDSEPVEVDGEEDEEEHVEFVSSEPHSRRKPKRPQIAVR
jgi:hypothetical protein